MYNNVVSNFKKIISSILPIIIGVIILSFLFKIDGNIVIRFLSSAVILIIGLTLFTTGTDISLTKIGEVVSYSLLKKKKLSLILIICIFLGTFITILEPEFLTISAEANKIPTYVLLVAVSFSIGFSLMLGVFRIFKRIEFKQILISGYLLIFLLLIFSNMKVIPFAFDMSSVTAGAISASFILSFGGSLTSKIKKKKEDSDFGLLSICGMGPILMILLLGFIYKPTISYDSDPILKRLDFFETLWVNFYQVFLSLLPLIVFYLIFHFTKKKKNKKEFRSIIIGLVMVLLGITLFLTGGDVGFFKMGYTLGTNFKDINHFIIMGIGGLFGYFIAKLEPALKVLISYIEDTTNGGIKEKFLEVFLCLGVSISVILSLYRVLNGYSVMMFLIPTYFLAILLAFFTPNNFLAIAFDASGVVAGTMTSSFLLPLLVGVASNVTTSYLQEAFGILSLISIIPVIILEIVGLIYQVEKTSIDTTNLDDSIVDLGDL